jgi:hypothetical protein
MDVADEIRRAIAEASEVERIAGFGEKLEEALVRLEEVARHMGMTAMYGNLMTAAAHAYTFLEVCGDVVVGWMLLWRARIAAKALGNGGTKDSAFYEGQIKSLEYWTQVMLPVTFAKMETILTGSSAVVDIPEEAFGSR